ncbi:MAG: YceI family protein [Cytophagaceae bacterium]
MKSMKLKTLFFALSATAFMYSCGGGQEATENTADLQANVDATEVSLTVNTKESNVVWKGTMLGVKSHSGDLKLKSGNLVVKGNEVISGSFTADLKSIAPTDSAYDKENPKSKLVGHLQSGDFFATEEYPEANFVVKNVEGKTLIGDLTIRGITNEEKVTDVSVLTEGDVVKASGKLTFDRQKYDVAFSTGAKDYVISDDIELSIELVGTK